MRFSGSFVFAKSQMSRMTFRYSTIYKVPKRTKHYCSRYQYLKEKVAEKKIEIRREKRRRKWAKLSKEFLDSKEWKHLRRMTLNQYGYRCMRCGHTGDASNWIEVDHVVPRVTDLKRWLDPTNLQVLCHECNTWKGRRTLDFRPTVST